jgi:Fic-DOC domain mobile mystery protein B
VTDLLEFEPGATPLAPDDLADLIPTHVSTRGHLNGVEQENILKADRWAFSRRRRDTSTLLSENYVRTLHKRMFGDVWRWAGAFRIRETNIGVDPRQIPMDLRSLLDDARGWIELNSYERDEFAVRFSHRIVSIHPFRNGNGRHSRMIADALVVSRGGERFTWGSAALDSEGGTRTRYIAALRAADDCDIAPLLAFARS